MTARYISSATRGKRSRALLVNRRASLCETCAREVGLTDVIGKGWTWRPCPRCARSGDALPVVVGLVPVGVRA